MNSLLRSTVCCLQWLLSLLCTSAFYLSGPTAQADEPPFLCRTAEHQRAEGAVLIAHGLNQRPETLADIEAALQASGFHTCLLLLSRHRGSGSCDSPVNVSIWREEFRRAYLHLQQQYPKHPKFAVGFSLGSLLTADFIQRQPGRPFERVILLAPPFSLRLGASLVRLLLPLRFVGVSLPSIAPEGYRSCRTTGLDAYHATITLIDSLQRVSPHVGAVPALLYARAADNIVDAAGVRNWLRRQHLPQWNFIELPEQAGSSNLPPHLISDSTALGQDAWLSLTGEVISFFSGESVSSSGKLPTVRAGSTPGRNTCRAKPDRGGPR